MNPIKHPLPSPRPPIATNTVELTGIWVKLGLQAPTQSRTLQKKYSRKSHSPLTIIYQHKSLQQTCVKTIFPFTTRTHTHTHLIVTQFHHLSLDAMFFRNDEQFDRVTSVDIAFGGRSERIDERGLCFFEGEILLVRRLSEEANLWGERCTTTKYTKQLMQDQTREKSCGNENDKPEQKKPQIQETACIWRSFLFHD